MNIGNYLNYHSRGFHGENGILHSRHGDQSNKVIKFNLGKFLPSLIKLNPGEHQNLRELLTMRGLDTKTTIIIPFLLRI